LTESHTQEVEKIFATDGTGGLRYLQDLLREDAPIHVPSALPFGDLYGFAGISEVVDDLLKRCDGVFKMEIVTSIGAGDLATIINKAEAQRNGESISYHNQWTFPLCLLVKS
jgi:hypothetical protein